LIDVQSTQLERSMNSCWFQHQCCVTVGWAFSWHLVSKKCCFSNLKQLAWRSL